MYSIIASRDKRAAWPRCMERWRFSRDISSLSLYKDNNPVNINNVPTVVSIYNRSRGLQGTAFTGP